MPDQWIKSTGNKSNNQDANPMAEMLDQYLSTRSIERGQVVSGVVVRIGDKDVIVDIGAKCEGIVPEQDLRQLSPAERETIQEGDEVLVYVVDTESGDNDNITLSLYRARKERDWREAQQLLEEQEIIEKEVVDCNKGGVIVQFGNLRGFVPGSLLARSRIAEQPDSDSDGEKRWAAVVGKTLPLQVIEVDQQNSRLVLSEQAAMRVRGDELLKELREGEVRQGQVTNLTNFGAFVNLGGIDGLVHLSELSWKRVSHPSEMIKVGQKVKVHVLKVDQERKQVALSLKSLQPDPWDSIEEHYQEGQVVKGTITRLTKWGAFASIVDDEAIEGLIHISELANNHITHPREVVKPGQVVTLRVIGVEKDRHRMALSLKQAVQGELADSDWEAELEQPEVETALAAALSEAKKESE